MLRANYQKGRALTQVQTAADELIHTKPKNIQEILYISDRTVEKIEHLEKLADLLDEQNANTLDTNLPPLVKIIEKKYRTEYVYLLDPGLRFSHMLPAWRKWGKDTGSRKTLQTLSLFYLWLEARRQDELRFPLASEVYRDSSMLQVNILGSSFITDHYGDFANLINTDELEKEEDNSVSFLYVLSEEGDFYIGQAAHLATHSQLIHGARALGAGILTIKDGKINYIDNASGHYNPTEAMFLNTIKRITERYGQEIFSDDLEKKCFSRREVGDLREPKDKRSE